MIVGRMARCRAASLRECLVQQHKASSHDGCHPLSKSRSWTAEGACARDPSGTAGYASCVPLAPSNPPQQQQQQQERTTGRRATPSSSGAVLHAAASDPLHRQERSTRRAAPISSSIAFLHAAVGEPLHRRLAALWQLPEEVVWERQQALMGILGPSGLDSTSHALLMLVRCPTLREASGPDKLRHSLKQLHRLGGDIDRAAVLTAAYKFPWILTTQQQQPTAAAASQASSVGGQQGACNSWSHELAAVILERERQRAEEVQLAAGGSSGAAAQQHGGGGSGGGSSGSSWMLSPAVAAAAVRAYVAGAAVAQAVGKLARLLPFTSSAPAAAAARPAAGTDAPDAHHQQQHQQAPTAVGDVWAQLASAQQQHVLLQQLLASCPHLVALPPEVLLARWQHLVAVLGHADGGAARLATTNSYLLFDYDDCAEAAAEAAAVRAAYA